MKDYKELLKQSKYFDETGKLGEWIEDATEAIHELQEQVKLLTFEPVLEKLQAQNESLQEQVIKLEGNMGFENFVSVATRWLENYPPDIFTGVSGDPGPVFVVAIRNAIKAMGRANS